MRKLIHCMTAILSLTLLTGCASTEIITVEKTVVPEITFPVFPLSDEMTRNADGTVSVPGEWLVRLEEYHIRIGETQRNYEMLRELYEKKVRERGNE